MAKISPLMILPPLIFAGLAAMFYLGMQREDPDALPSVKIGLPAPPVALTELGGATMFGDAELRVVDGDHQAFESLMLRYQDRLIGFFFHLVRDRTLAEDMAQEVFLRVYRSRERYSAQARFSTWLFRIAHNLASNQRRGIARRREIPLSGNSASDGEFSSEDQNLAEKSALMPTRQIDSKEMQEIVREALGSLNERQRTAVLLHKFEGMSYQDIGDVMGLNVVAVKSLISRARCNLKETLERHLE